MPTLAESALRNSRLKSAQSQGEEVAMNVADINQDSVKLILMDGFDYSFSRMLGEAQKWKCTNTSCYAYFKILGDQLLPGVMAHTHQREVDAAVVGERDVGTIQEHKVEALGEQRAERPGGTKIYHAKSTKGPVQSLRHLLDTSGTVAKRKTPSRAGPRNTVKRQRLLNPGSPPDFGFISDQDLSSSHFAAVMSDGASPAKSSSSSQLAALISGAGSPPPPSPSTSHLDGLISFAASPAPSPPNSPELSEMGPPPTPPLSPHDSDPSTPPPPVFDLVEANYRPSFSPDFAAHFLRQPPNSPDGNRQTSPTKPSTSTSSRTARRTQSAERPKKLAKITPFKEFENAVMKLDNETFGYAVTSMLSELPSKTSEEIRYEIATLLFDVVEDCEKKKKRTKSQT